MSYFAPAPGQTSQGLTLGYGDALDVNSGGVSLSDTLGGGAVERVLSGGISRRDVVAAFGSASVGYGV